MEIGKRLRSAIRETDLAARYAGDEFVLLLDDVPSFAKAEEIRRHVETTLQRPLELIESKVLATRLVASGAVGLAMYPQGGINPHELLQTADHDMYERKHRARELAPLT